MGPRALIKFTEQDGTEKPFACVYRQFDGYPEGLGADLAKILKGRVLVNGFQDAATQLNGMGCLAAFVVAGLKEGCGNVYLYPADAVDCGEEFTYWLSPGVSHQETTPKGWTQEHHEIRLRVMDRKHVLYDGSITEFDPAKCVQQEEA